MERSPFAVIRNYDPLDEARRLCDIYRATVKDRDERTANKTGDPYFLNLAAVNAKRDMDNAIAANRRMIVRLK